jgi:hypothetical protein
MRHGVSTGRHRTVVWGTVEERFWAKVERGPGCWEWTARRHRKGYGQFTMDRGGSRWTTVAAHRVAWELTHGPIPEGQLVCHRCDNPPCCNPEHLFLGTTSDNVVDSVVKGRWTRNPWRNQPKGERTANAKLTEAAVREIRQRYATGGISQQTLATEYGVNQTKISAVVRRETWAHVD